LERAERAHRAALRKIEDLRCRLKAMAAGKERSAQ